MTHGKYYELLGIPDAAPDYYRLLGVDRFERSAEVISNAADRQTVYLRTLRHRDAQQLLNEVAAARVCLLDRKRRAAYDLTLLDAPAECEMDMPLLTNLEVVPEVPSTPYQLDPVVAEVTPEEVAVRGKRRPKTSDTLLVGIAAIVCVATAVSRGLMAGVIVFGTAIALIGLIILLRCAVSVAPSEQPAAWWRTDILALAYRAAKRTGRFLMAICRELIHGLPRRANNGLKLIAGEGNDLLLRFLQILVVCLLAAGVVAGIAFYLGQ